MTKEDLTPLKRIISANLIPLITLCVAGITFYNLTTYKIESLEKQVQEQHLKIELLQKEKAKQIEVDKIEDKFEVGIIRVYEKIDELKNIIINDRRR